MKSKFFAPLAFSVLALSLLGGCANITDQITKSVVETAVNSATGGKVNIDEKNGSMTFKDDQGNTAQIGGGKQRPTSTPADMPSLPNATGYAWIAAAEGGFLSFMVPGSDSNATCDQELVLVKAAGWADAKSGFNMQIGNTKTSTYEKAGFTLVLSCASDDDAKEVAVTLTKSKGTQDSGAASMTEASAATSTSVETTNGN